MTLAGGVVKTVNVTIQKGTVKTTKISGVPKKITLKKGKKQTLAPVLAPITTQQKVTYTTSNKKVCTVTKGGVITAKKKGTYKVATDKVNKQIEQIDKIMDKYDKGAMLVGEGPLTKDLINITDTDFKRVSAVSIGIVFVIILLLFKSITLPIILVGVIEFAIFVNMGIPFYTGTKLPFVASIVIGTIQLGSTVDYAILMTTRYLRERRRGAGKFDAITTAHKFSAQSIIVSALSFFAATIGVGLYSNIDMISSLCILMARGALISMAVVVFILPSLFMVFDKIIIRTSKV